MSMEVTTWFLEMKSPNKLQRAKVPSPAPRFEQAAIPSPELSRYLYASVGGNHYWRERLDWNYAQWKQWLERPELETWLLSVQGTPAGYIELEKKDGNVEIVNFGLLPAFIGRGLGGHLLTQGLVRAWEMGADRVWVHTSSLDAPAAKKNFESRGMHQYDWSKSKSPALGDVDGPWPDAGRTG